MTDDTPDPYEVGYREGGRDVAIDWQIAWDEYGPDGGVPTFQEAAERLARCQEHRDGIHATRGALVMTAEEIAAGLDTLPLYCVIRPDWKPEYRWRQTVLTRQATTFDSIPDDELAHMITGYRVLSWPIGDPS